MIMFVQRSSFYAKCMLILLSSIQPVKVCAADALKQILQSQVNIVEKFKNCLHHTHATWNSLPEKTRLKIKIGAMLGSLLVSVSTLMYVRNYMRNVIKKRQEQQLDRANGRAVAGMICGFMLTGRRTFI